MTEGPLGFPMPDNLAKSLEQLIKTLPKECTYRKAASVPTSTEFVEGEKADISLVSVETMDRENEVVIAKGIDRKFFDSNPIVTFAHKYDELPVGRAAWLKVVPGGLKAKTIYSDATETARACWQMTKEGILRGKSIGFLPTKIRSPAKSEPQWKDASAVIESSILLEYAIAPIPMHPDALVEAVAKGLADEALLKRLGLKLPKKTRNVRVNETALLLKALELVKIDPEKIARQVYASLANRGKV